MSAAVPSGRILVTGGSGQLAGALAAAAPDRIHVVGRPDFEFDRPQTMAACIEAVAPAIVINAAAWTAVDLAEDEPEAAARANTAGPAQLAGLCESVAIPLIHVSTDYVFDGLKGSPYTEADRTRPTGVYGRTKLAGEQAVLAACQQAIIARTSWVYSSRGKNFVRTMLAAGESHSMLRVVGDQYGCPTSADDLAAALLAVVDHVEAGWRDVLGGVVHIAGSGATSWHGLAKAVFTQAARHGRAVPELRAIATSDWPTRARRPPDSRLDCRRLAVLFGTRLPSWEASVARTVDQLLGNDAVASTGAASAG